MNASKSSKRVKPAPTTESAVLSVMRGEMDPSELKPIIAEALVNLGFYAVYVSLGLTGLTMLTNMVPYAILAFALFVFGACIVVWASLVAAAYSAPPTMRAAEWLTDKVKSTYFAAKHRVTSFTFPIPASVQ